MTDATWGYGSLLQINTGSGMTTVAEVMDIAGPQTTRDRVDVTNHSSPNGYEEFILTVKRSGEVTFKMNLIPDDPSQDETTGLFSLYNSGVLTPMQIVWPSPAGGGPSIGSVTFSAYVTGFRFNEPVNAQLSADVTLKPSGEIVMI